MNVSELRSALAHQGPALTDAEVQALELEIGHRLPEDYRQFLLVCNGGYAGGRLCFNPDSENAGPSIDWLGGIRRDVYGNSLLSTIQEARGYLPDTLMWIGWDCFGNAICIGIAGDERGRVYFWDHEHVIDNDDDWDRRVETAQNIELLATSFAEFRAGLQLDPDFP